MMLQLEEAVRCTDTSELSYEPMLNPYLNHLIELELSNSDSYVRIFPWPPNSESFCHPDEGRPRSNPLTMTDHCEWMLSLVFPYSGRLRRHFRGGGACRASVFFIFHSVFYVTLGLSSHPALGFLYYPLRFSQSVIGCDRVVRFTPANDQHIHRRECTHP